MRDRWLSQHLALSSTPAQDAYYDTQAILAYCKAAWLKLLIYQQLVMLGAPGQYNEMAKQLASDAYTWLKARYDAMKVVLPSAHTKRKQV